MKAAPAVLILILSAVGTPTGLLPLSPSPLAWAQPSEVTKLTEADKSAIQSVIRRQLEAFQQEDAEVAFSLAAPGIQDRFSTANQFVDMVRTHYAPVYEAEEAVFLDLTTLKGVPTQQVRLVDSQGKTAIAFYLMEQQSDDSWRIGACYLRPVEVRGIEA